MKSEYVRESVESGIRGYMDCLRDLRCFRLVRKGLSQGEISRLLSEEGLDIPEGLRSYFRILNGQRGMGVGLLPSFSVRKSARVLSLSDLLSVYSNIRATEEVYRASGVRQQRTADPGVRDEFWCAEWFPFATSGDEGGLVVTYFVDFSPSDDGVAGQVVEEVWRIASTGEAIHRTVIADSLDLFFRSLVDRGVFFCEGIGVLLNPE